MVGSGTRDGPGGGGGPWWATRVCVVTDAHEVRQRVGEATAARGAVPEAISWAEAPSLEPPLAALAVHVERGAVSRALAAFDAWTPRAWQPCSVVSLAASVGAARLRARLRALRYPRVSLRAGIPSRAWIARSLRPVLEERAWLAAWFVRELGSPAPEVVEAVAAGALGEKPATSVSAWARRLGLVGWELGRLLKGRGLPPPKGAAAPTARLAGSGDRVHLVRFDAQAHPGPRGVRRRVRERQLPRTPGQGAHRPLLRGARAG